MRNIKLTIAYDGTRYSGWQFQNNAKSIQESIESALEKIISEKVRIIGSGRTDAGVHARAQIANFKTRTKIPVKNIQMALNTSLPKDIVIFNIEEVDHSFNSLHHAKKKLYRYTIMNADFLDPLMRHTAARCFYKLDMSAMRKAARYLVGTHDFKSFQLTEAKEKSSVRTIHYLKIKRDGYFVHFDIEANGFLYNMVRNIVGTLIDVGRGKITADAVKEILKKKDRRSSGPTMPAQGLCLMRVDY